MTFCFFTFIFDKLRIQKPYLVLPRSQPALFKMKNTQEKQQEDSNESLNSNNQATTDDQKSTSPSSSTDKEATTDDSKPRGWHRGLVLLDDGFLVGSTVVRGDAVNWINWNFDTAKSKTGVTFVPWEYENHSRGNEVCSVQFLTERSAKVFSLLRTPDGVH